MMNACAVKAAKLLMPTAASALVPSRPTMPVSTRFITFCDTMPPMIGSARLKMVLVREVLNDRWLLSCAR